jgi:hypothetical protein
LDWREATTEGGRKDWPTKMVDKAAVGLVVRLEKITSNRHQTSQNYLGMARSHKNGRRSEGLAHQNGGQGCSRSGREVGENNIESAPNQNYLGMARSHNRRRSEGLAHQNGGQGCSRSGREVGENNIESAPNQNYLGMARSHNRRRSEGLTHQNGGQSCSRSGREFGENNIESTPNQNSLKAALKKSRVDIETKRCPASAKKPQQKAAEMTGPPK